KDEALRVQLLAYAAGDESNANKARRISLSRALAVRAYLIDKQIQSTRMDVRALGNRTTDSPRDRVDVVLVSR
ncbi:MAG TPA: lysophospholipase, partial [Thalassobaculum sp.]